jgi:hypothetical protein
VISRINPPTKAANIVVTGFDDTGECRVVAVLSEEEV